MDTLVHFAHLGITLSFILHRDRFEKKSLSSKGHPKQTKELLLSLHSRKLTWIPKRWFGNGNSLINGHFHFFASMLVFWGVSVV